MTEAQRTQSTVPPAEPIPLTVSQYLALDGNYEMHHGELVEMSPKTRRPMRFARKLFRALDTFVIEHNLGEVTMEDSFVLDGDPRTTWVRDAREPDIAFVARERVEAHEQEFGEDGPWYLAPDLAIEVISPTDKYSNVLEKAADYLAFGVRLVIVIDPKTRSTRVHTPDNPGGAPLSDTDTLHLDPVLPGWSMPLTELFGAKE